LAPAGVVVAGAEVAEDVVTVAEPGTFGAGAAVVEELGVPARHWETYAVSVMPFA
jgi:hypothetical protein